MGTRAIVVLLVGLTLTSVHLAEAQQPVAKVPRIGFLDSGSASDPRNILGVEALRQGLRDLGYVEGKNIILEWRYAEGQYERFPELVAELIHLKVDVIAVGNSGDTTENIRLD